jgi:hypothetical protein
VIGYVLVEPNTHSIDWDGLIHGSLDGALREVVRVRDNPIEGDRPCCGADVPYLIATVTVDAAIQARALAAMQAEFDAEAARLEGGAS